MIIGQTAAQRIQKLKDRNKRLIEWHPFWCILPRRLRDGRLAVCEKVERRFEGMNSVSGLLYSGVEYREIDQSKLAEALKTNNFETYNK